MIINYWNTWSINSYTDSSIFDEEEERRYTYTCKHVYTSYKHRWNWYAPHTDFKRILRRIRNANLALTISHYLNAFISSKLLLAAVSFIILFLPFSRSSSTTRKRGVRVRVLKLCNGERDPGKLVEEINQYRGR